MCACSAGDRQAASSLMPLLLSAAGRKAIASASDFAQRTCFLAFRFGHKALKFTTTLTKATPSGPQHTVRRAGIVVRVPERDLPECAGVCARSRHRNLPESPSPAVSGWLPANRPASLATLFLRQMLAGTPGRSPCWPVPENTADWTPSDQRRARLPRLPAHYSHHGRGSEACRPGAGGECPR